MKDEIEEKIQPEDRVMWQVRNGKNIDEYSCNRAMKYYTPSILGLYPENRISLKGEIPYKMTCQKAPE